MMRRLYLMTTLLFWLFVAVLWASRFWLPPIEKGVAVDAEKVYSSIDLSVHHSPDNCWMAIRGNVYDLSTYLPDHPAPPELVESWCGKDATEAYNTKTRGRSHSSRADDLLAKYQVGKFIAGVSE